MISKKAGSWTHSFGSTASLSLLFLHRSPTTRLPYRCTTSFPFLLLLPLEKSEAPSLLSLSLSLFRSFPLFLSSSASRILTLHRYLFLSKRSTAMAVQAQYPANLLLLDRQETERSNKDMDFPPPPLLDQSAVFFSSNGGNANLRKRGREVVPPAFGVPMVFVPPPLLPMQQTVFSLQPAQTPTPAMIGLAQLRSPAPPPQVSTGLRLALDQQNPIPQSDFDLSSFISEELAAQINQQKDEIDQFLLAQREQLRRSFTERRHRHYRALLKAVEQSIGRRFREKEEEIERATRLSSELEDRLARLQTESMAWQSKAMAEQATAASLHAQLQRAAAEPAAGKECSGESPADDAESAYIDPERPEIAKRACHACLRRPASVVLIPCRHLCLCPACDSAGATAGGVAGGGCPVCGCPRTGSVQVFLS